MILSGKLHAETPIYRGNARKTLFTRDGDGTQRLVSLAGEIAGTAESLMDAFIGSSRGNSGLLNRIWLRLYGFPMPSELIDRVRCNLQESSYPADHLFGLRMGIKLDEDRWAAEANANYKIETLFRNSVFDIELSIRDSVLAKGDNAARLYYVLNELEEGRFWFGAGKSKGLGRCRLELDKPLSIPNTPPDTSPKANHLTISLMFNALNPVLVGWNWGKLDPANIPAFIDIDGSSLIEAIPNIPEPIRERLRMVIGGPILGPEDWKEKFSEYLPRVIAIWLKERSTGKIESWVFPSSAVNKLGKGKYGLSKKILEGLEPITDHPFPSKEAAEDALNEALGKKFNMAKRVLAVLESETSAGQQFSNDAWEEVAGSLGLSLEMAEQLAAQIHSEPELVKILTPACEKILPDLYQQIDRRIKLLQSDSWVETEIANREEHLRIKIMLLNGEIGEDQWEDRDRPPAGIKAATWREFVESHSRVRFSHMLNPENLQKSITNDQNFIDFIQAYRDRTRQELSQPYNTDFRSGGISNQEVSREYGKPYDTVFMRMLSWAPSSQEDGSWEIYIPGSTIKGAFRKRATQVLRTLWGERSKTEKTLDRIFGAQNQVGLVFFSDAYLTDPHDPEHSWCSMDGVRMNPQTGKPVEEAKADYLFAYGSSLSFHLRMDIQDIDEQDMEAISVLAHLVRDFQRGDIPLGGEKTSGFGWVQASVDELSWIATSKTGLGEALFGEQELVQDGIWHRLDLNGKSAAAAIASLQSLDISGKEMAKAPPIADLGFVSHRSFGGHCGKLVVKAEVLTPVSIQESGEPSFSTNLDGQPVNGWDFFSMSPPEADSRGSARVYALPSKSIKGMIRHIYSIASGSNKSSEDISRLNPTDSLFGWVGNGPNQAIMGRISFSFGSFDPSPQLAWFKIPYPYGEWHFANGKWTNVPDSSASKLVIAETWRIFPHSPLAPIVKKLEEFQPDTPQANYARAVLPGAKSQFTVRFWNLDDQELQRLIWCIALEEGLAHKIGRSRYLGFGSLGLHIQADSYIIDWNSRYSGDESRDWCLPISVDEWIKPDVIENYKELRKALDAKQL